MSDASRISVHPRTSISPEEARDCRARAWQFVLACHAKKKGTSPGAPEDAMKGFNDRATKIIQG